MHHIVDKESCGQLLKQLRLQRGLSVRQAAKDTTVSVSTLLSLESGRWFPSMAKLVLLLQFYGETISIGADPGENGTS